MHVGTLSKAFGSFGGFVACSRAHKQLLLCRGRPAIYSTALPMPAVAAALTALKCATPQVKRRRASNRRKGGNEPPPPPHPPPPPTRPPTRPPALALRPSPPQLRATLWDRVETFGAASGLQPQSAIVPIVIGAEAAALDASAQLLRRGLLVPAIRPPTVPRGTARLRVALSAAHSQDDILDLAAAIRDLGLVPPSAGHNSPSIVARL